MNNIIKYLYINGCDIKKDEPLKNHTYFRLGGKTPYMIFPKTKEIFINTLKVLKENNINFKIIGGGANLIVKDENLDFLILSTKYLNKINIKNEDVLNYILKERNNEEYKKVEVYAETGIYLSNLVYQLAENNLSGMEFSSGIPGTLGGAIFMNAGAYDGEIKQVISEVEIIDLNDLKIKKINNENMNFSYRRSILQNSNKIALSTILKLEMKEKEFIINKIKRLSEKRWERQPLEYPSAGSIFKRPKEDFYVGTTIEKMGLKGYRIGDAEISEKHAGFIINRGNATFKDVMSLIDYIKEKVRKEYNIILNVEPEIWK
ncbi:UDP-N-acetylmuramate dehydrogenase [Oceanotoga sp. DSM 15011]|uniref:UDP-N-acetylmuramate dehydrogenase n=1 Tax=Oceanotoga sp. DSM 15011 TaxID=2984951 RepID=UPI0021F44818|nr:UDP-N-acetylmuramate dehydrogenase [Oceanotoga sp. DSM 15011]UYP00931.1 UDP-N-acetylmuramate dehydrogenase [Oceanotoga sp. DSM 15011]